MVRLPYRDSSEAVLIGTSNNDTNLVAAISDLHAVLTDPGSGGFARDRCRMLVDVPTAQQVDEQLQRSVAAATDTLLVYFGGRAEVDDLGLRLASMTSGSHVDWLRWSALRKLLIDSPARYKVVVLDCANAGYAAQDWKKPERISARGGTCVLATPSLTGARLSMSLTEALVGLLNTDVIGGNGYVSVGDLRQVRRLFGVDPIYVGSGDIADTLALAHRSFAPVPPSLPDAKFDHHLREEYERLTVPERQLVARASLWKAGNLIPVAVVSLLAPAADPQVLRDSNLLRLTSEGLEFPTPEAREFAIARLDEEDQDTVAELRFALRRREMIEKGIAPKAHLTRDYPTTEDKLDYRPYAEAIATFIRHRDSKPPLTIGVKGPWGSGKTSLMRMIRAELDDQRRIALTTTSRERLSRRRRAGSTTPVTNAEVLQHTAPTAAPTDETEHIAVTPPESDWRATVWFNPWMYQNTEQVWAGLAHAIINQVTARLQPGDRERFWLELNLSRLDRLAVRRRVHRVFVERLLPLAIVFVLAAGVAAILWVTGLAVDLARWFLAGGAGALALGGLARYVAFRNQNATVGLPQLLSGPSAPGLFDAVVPDPGYAGRTGFLHVVQHDMTRVLRLVATEDRPLVVFVDDLDRCSPGVVAEVIEAINLFLAGDFKNCVFVLAMEPDVVAAHVEVAYAELVEKLGKDNGELGWRFLEKIVQLPLSLPVIDHERQVPEYVRALLDVRADQPLAAEPLPEANEEPERPGRTPSAPVVGPAPGSPGQRPVSADEIREAADRIREAGPTVETLPEIIRVVRATYRLDHRAVLSAAAEIFADLYTDSAAFATIDAAMPVLRSSNPREIKRYVNLFRFYSFITFRRRAEGTAPSDEQLAKLAALAIRWPDLLSALSKPDALGRLERAAKGGSDEAWNQALAQSGCVGAVTRLHDLRAFLAKGPEIGLPATALL